MALSQYMPAQWMEIAGIRLKMGASTWFMAEKARIRDGQHTNRANWTEFQWELIAAFAPQKDEEQAQKALKMLK